MPNTELARLVAQVNAGLALATWPFVIYEVFSKSAPISNLKSNLDVRRGRLLHLVATQIEQALRPFWPRTTSRILLDPEFRVEIPPVFSDAALDAVRDSLARSESLLARAAQARRLTGVILRLDRVTYWLVYLTAVESMAFLFIWFFANSLSDFVARSAVVTPVSTAAAALLAAGIRQTYHHKAQREIADDLADSRENASETR